MIELSENAIKVLEKRYLLKDEMGKVIETPDQMFRRVARAVAAAEPLTVSGHPPFNKIEDEFYKIMSNLEFLPNSPTLMNAGKPLGQLSACFVLPVEDSIEGIFDAIKNTAVIHKSGGGTGFSFSRLRPKNDLVKTTSGVSSGPVSFMQVFNAATEAVKQGGTRRGANMGILRVNHPDILEFIKAKEDLAMLTNFNLSVAITDEFMEAVKEERKYDLVNPKNGARQDSLDARSVWNLIIDHAWATGEPGIIFIDEMNRHNPTPSMGNYEASNPCGEQPLLPYESCNLGSINLARMTLPGRVDWVKLERVVKIAVRFLDNVIDVNKYPLPVIEEVTKRNRKIGLGVMGWADMLIQLGIRYDSEKALKLAGEVMAVIQDVARDVSTVRGREKGAVDGRYRNITVTTIAPTGTISIIAGCSSGIEPIFARELNKNVMDGTLLMEKHEGVFKTAHEILPEWHVRMQAAFQKHTDNAVSKTVNLPAAAGRDDVERVFELAYELKCKGVTVYRDGCRAGQVLTVNDALKVRDEKQLVDWANDGMKEAWGASVIESGEYKRAQNQQNSIAKGVLAGEVQVGAAEQPIERYRPSVLTGHTFKQKTGCGSIYITINEDEKGPCELFATIGKAGGCAGSQAQALGRLVSLAWKQGIPVVDTLKQLSDISCHSHCGMGDKRVRSCADAMAKAIREYLEGKGVAVLPVGKTLVNGACPECGGQVEHEGGCVVCRSCGFSECG
jgi:ribonucleoside-diphosphate reductase alpha chain